MANPALTDRRLRQITSSSETGRRMSHGGVAKALGIYFVFALVGAYFGWGRGENGVITGNTNTWMLVAIISAFVISLVIINKPRLASSLGVVYALLEGFAIGVISAVYNASYRGIVAEALGATVCVAACVWFLYGTGIIKVTDKVRRVIVMATMGAVLFYGITLLMMVFGGPDLDGKGGVLGVGISLVLAVIAASTFLLDFDRIDKLIAANADASYDWYGAFGLLISFVWLYLEILNILGKLRGGRVR
jgi:uncharacterized YccA/Bax inhibitor family protein